MSQARTDGRLSLRRNFSWTLQGNIAFAAANWLLVVVLAKLTSPESVGRFTYAVAVVTPLFIFSNLGLRSVQATDAASEFGFGTYFALRLACTGAALALTAAIATASAVTGNAWLVVLAGTLKAADALSDICYGLFQRAERMDRVASSLMLRALAGFGCWCAAIAASRDPATGLLAVSGAWTAVLIFFDWRLARREGPPRWNVPELKRLLVLSAPLGLVTLMQSLYQNIPRYAIEGILGSRQLGIFGAIASLMAIGNTLVSALGQSAAPRLAILHAEGKKSEFARLLRKLLLVGLPIGGGGIAMAALFPGPVLTLFFRPEYANEGRLFLLLMAAGALQYLTSLLGIGVTAMRQYRIQLWIQCFSVSLILGLSWILVRSHGVLGAAWTLIAGYFALASGLALTAWVALR